jgi:predicted deacylase
VQLGQRIEAGAALGTVSDLLGDDRRTIYAEQSGIVIVLRSLASVSAGESLAVVLEIDEREGL